MQARRAELACRGARQTELAGRGGDAGMQARQARQVELACRGGDAGMQARQAELAGRGGDAGMQARQAELAGRGGYVGYGGMEGMEGMDGDGGNGGDEDIQYYLETSNDEEYIEQIQKLEKSDASLNELIPKYNRIIQLLEDGIQNKHYILFIVWSFIFILIFVSFLFALLDINQDINLMNRMIIYIFIIYILYYIFNNIVHFIKKYV